ncbi:MAG: flagellar basal body L-ring protein FlgH [Planctomycetota bacterium]
MRTTRLALFATVLLLGSAALGAEVDNPYGYASLIAQPRASRKNDRVTILVELNTQASHESTVDTSKESSANWTLSKLFRIGKDKDGDIIAKPFPDARKPELDVSSTREHTGEGETSTRESITATISGRVVEVLPNGHLVVEARRTVTYRGEESIVRFTGTVDPNDLNADSSVSISYVMEPSVKFLGEGDVSEALRRGWLAKFFDKVSPF